MKFIKPALGVLFLLTFLLCIIAYFTLKGSLPSLDGKIKTPHISAQTKIQRDRFGTAIISAENKNDSAFALGYAHAQDRLFQMDLLRRTAAGELSEIVGAAALNIDRTNRFHQFRKRAAAIIADMPADQLALLQAYADGVNEAAQAYQVRPFEYLLTSSDFSSWKMEDSLLVSFSMYLDLQGGQVERDLTNTFILERFGQSMLSFLNQASPYQAALDGSVMSSPSTSIPDPSITQALRHTASTQHHEEEMSLFAYETIEEVDDIGSNNWAVTGDLSNTQSAMLSDDMHLGLRVPPIWYRAQLNYKTENEQVQVTGVSLPGSPGIIVGSNGHIAWGFTNANLDNVDWIALSPYAITEKITETILTPTGAEEIVIEMSQYGPVKQIRDKKYALSWVAHQAYAVNVRLNDLAEAKDLQEGFTIAEKVRIPIQNLMLADADGNAGWRTIGALTARPAPTLAAISEQEYSSLWQEHEFDSPQNINPASGRLWTANARVMPKEDMLRFGDGGYALGIRGLQIRDLLYAKSEFSEKDFYDIQLDNQARFLVPWHTLLVDVLASQQGKYQTDIELLEAWKNCACSDSIGYTLTRYFRSTVINRLLEPINQQVKANGLSLRNALRKVEPAVWQLIDGEADSWLPSGEDSYQAFLLSSYEKTKADLIKQYGANPSSLKGLEWGEVNKLSIKHPFSSQLGPFGSFLNMPESLGFGDSYMPAVQRSSFGASQRLIVQPGNESAGILTIPGGQSGHPLSTFYNTGYSEYLENQAQRLLPEEPIHSLIFVLEGND